MWWPRPHSISLSLAFTEERLSHSLPPTVISRQQSNFVLYCLISDGILLLFHLLVCFNHYADFYVTCDISLYGITSISVATRIVRQTWDQEGGQSSICALSVYAQRTRKARYHPTTENRTQVSWFQFNALQLVAPYSHGRPKSCLISFSVQW